MPRLCVCIDQVAALRETRRRRDPDPVAAAIKAETGSADGIVVHLRENRRHIKDRDVKILKEVVSTHLNVAIAPNEEMLKRMSEILPDMVTFLPERANEISTESGLDIVANLEYIQECVTTLRARNIVVSILIDPNIHQLKAAARIGADYIQLNTLAFASAVDMAVAADELEKLNSMAIAANKLGLGISAGLGLNYQNIREICQIEPIEELNVGHAIMARAVLTGIEQAVRDMVTLMR